MLRLPLHYSIKLLIWRKSEEHLIQYFGSTRLWHCCFVIIMGTLGLGDVALGDSKQDIQNRQQSSSPVEEQLSERIAEIDQTNRDLKMIQENICLQLTI